METRLRATDNAKRRRKRCLDCGHRWTTVETPTGVASNTPEYDKREYVTVPVPMVSISASAWQTLESIAAQGTAVFIEYDPSKKMWLASLSDEFEAVEAPTAEQAINDAYALMLAYSRGRDKSA